MLPNKGCMIIMVLYIFETLGGNKDRNEACVFAQLDLKRWLTALRGGTWGRRKFKRLLLGLCLTGLKNGMPNTQFVVTVQKCDWSNYEASKYITILIFFTSLVIWGGSLNG